MSPVRAGGRPGLRACLAGVLVFDVFFLAWHNFFEPPENLEREYWPEFLVALHDNTAALVVLSVAALVGVTLFALRRYPLAAGGVAVVCLAVSHEAYASVVPSPRRMFFTSGAMLAGWLLGIAAARLRNKREGIGSDPELEDRLGEAGALAGLAATYLNAGIQKVSERALFEPTSLRSLIYTHHPVGDTSLFGTISTFVADHTWMAATMSFGAVGIQLFAVGLISRRWWLRALAGTLLISFHLGTLVLLDIIYVEATALLIAFAYPWHRLFHRRPPQTVQDPQFEISQLWPLMVGVGAAIGLSFVIRAPAEIPLYQAGQHHDGDETAGVPAVRAGPFEAGAQLGGWKIVHLRADGDSLVISLEHSGHGQGVRIGLVAAEGSITASVFRTELDGRTYAAALDEIRKLVGQQSGEQLAGWLDELRGD